MTDGWMLAACAELDVQYGLAITLQMMALLRAPTEDEVRALDRAGLDGFLQDATRLLLENRGDSLAAFQAVRRIVWRELEQR